MGNRGLQVSMCHPTYGEMEGGADLNLPQQWNDPNTCNVASAQEHLQWPDVNCQNLSSNHWDGEMNAAPSLSRFPGTNWNGGAHIQEHVSSANVAGMSQWSNMPFPLQGVTAPGWASVLNASTTSAPGVSSSPPQAVQSNPPRKPVLLAKVADLFEKMTQHGRGKKVVALLRGVPGSGKSEVARRMRDLAVTKGLDAPRIHSIDDYFMLVSGRQFV